MTDSLTMQGVRTIYGDERVPVLALKAGADILADPPHLPSAFRAVMAAIEAGEVSEERLERSVERILRLKDRLGLLDDPFVDVEAVAGALGTTEDEAVAREVGAAATTVLRDRKGWLPLRSRWTVLVTGLKPEGGGALVNELERLGHDVTTRWAGVEAGTRKVARTARLAREHDVTVVITKHLGVFPAQRQLVRRLLGSGGRVIVVFAGSPFDVTWFPDAAAQVATYSTVPASMFGLAQVLDGHVPAQGALPVRIPRPGGGTLYAFGHGLQPTRSPDAGTASGPSTS
jgi:beta-N-acetylhexosaminidase